MNPSGCGRGKRWVVSEEFDKQCLNMEQPEGATGEWGARRVSVLTVTNIFAAQVGDEHGADQAVPEVLSEAVPSSVQEAAVPTSEVGEFETGDGEAPDESTWWHNVHPTELEFADMMAQAPSGSQGYAMPMTNETNLYMGNEYAPVSADSPYDQQGAVMHVAQAEPSYGAQAQYRQSSFSSASANHHLAAMVAPSDMQVPQCTFLAFASPSAQSMPHLNAMTASSSPSSPLSSPVFSSPSSSAQMAVRVLKRKLPALKKPKVKGLARGATWVTAPNGFWAEGRAQQRKNWLRESRWSSSDRGPGFERRRSNDDRPYTSTDPFGNRWMSSPSVLLLDGRNIKPALTQERQDLWWALQLTLRRIEPDRPFDIDIDLTQTYVQVMHYIAAEVRQFGRGRVKGRIRQWEGCIAAWDLTDESYDRAGWINGDPWNPVNQQMRRQWRMQTGAYTITPAVDQKSRRDGKRNVDGSWKEFPMRVNVRLVGQEVILHDYVV